MKKYNLQEQIVPISSLESLFVRNILPLGIDLSDTPNNIKPEVIELLNEYYHEPHWYKHEYRSAPPMMTLNLIKLENDYANEKIKLKRYIKVNPESGDIIVYKLLNMCTSPKLECFVSIHIKPFFSSSDNPELIYLLPKTETIVYKYQIKKGRVKAL